MFQKNALCGKLLIGGWKTFHRRDNCFKCRGLTCRSFAHAISVFAWLWVHTISSVDNKEEESLSLSMMIDQGTNKTTNSIQSQLRCANLLEERCGMSLASTFILNIVGNNIFSKFLNGNFKATFKRYVGACNMISEWKHSIASVLNLLRKQTATETLNVILIDDAGSYIYSKREVFQDVGRSCVCDHNRQRSSGDMNIFYKVTEKFLDRILVSIRKNVRCSFRCFAIYLENKIPDTKIMNRLITLHFSRCTYLLYHNAYETQKRWNRKTLLLEKHILKKPNIYLDL